MRPGGSKSYHVDCGVCEVDKGRYHLALAASLVEGTRIPQRENGAHELDKVLLPAAICGRTAACIGSVSQGPAVIGGGATYASRCRGT